MGRQGNTSRLREGTSSEYRPSPSWKERANLWEGPSLWISVWTTTRTVTDSERPGHMAIKEGRSDWMKSLPFLWLCTMGKCNWAATFNTKKPQKKI